MGEGVAEGAADEEILSGCLRPPSEVWTSRCGQWWGQASTHHSATTHGVLLLSPFSAADRLGMGSAWSISGATFLSRMTFFF